jgi:arylsulfatase A-like enzyme
MIQRVRAHVAAVGACATVQALTDLLLGVSLGTWPPAWYPPVYLVTTGVAAAAIGLAGALLRLPLAVGPALWVAWAGWSASLPWVGLAGAGIAAVSMVATPDGTRAAAARGAIPGAASGIALATWPALLERVSSRTIDQSLALQALTVLVLAAVMAGLFFAEVIRRRFRFVPAAGLLAVALAVVAGSAPWIRVALEGRETWPSPGTAEASDGAPHVILLILDTVRADHLSVYGYGRETTPNIDRLAENASTVVYPLALAPSPWTLPSHASLFSGTLPSSHGAHKASFFRDEGWIRLSLHAETTLAEQVRRSGYRTAAVLANSMLFTIDGLDRGFEVYSLPRRPQRARLQGDALAGRLLPDATVAGFTPYPDARTVNRHVLRLLDAADGRPCLIVANYMEAHHPYAPRRPFSGTFTSSTTAGAHGPAKRDDPPDRLELLAARYDEELRGLDAAIGELLDALDRRGILERSWIVVTSDHGEGFGEHGATYHGNTLYNEQVRVPLIVQPPRGTALPARDEPVGLLDVTATVAAIASGRVLGTGRDLRDPASPARPVPVEFFGDPRPSTVSLYGERADLPGRAVALGTFKLIEHGGRPELYRMDIDAAETEDVAAEDAARVAALVELLTPGRDAWTPGEESPDAPTAEELERLKALGYIR